MSPDWTQYEAIVGKRWAYYAPRFERFAQGKVASWNWAALFGTLAWLRYRRLYAWSWAYFFFSTPVLLVAYLASVATRDACASALAPGSPVAWLLGPLAILGWIVPPLLANRLYYNRVRSMVAAAAGAQPARLGTGGAFGALALQGFVVVVTAVGLPSYSDYRSRAVVTEGLNAAGVLKAPLEEVLGRQGRLPASIAEIASGATSTKNVSGVTLAPDGTLRATFGPAAGLLAGHTVQWIPRVEAGNKVAAWSCRSADLPAACLPPACR